MDLDDAVCQAGGEGGHARDVEPARRDDDLRGVDRAAARFEVEPAAVARREAPDVRPELDGR